MKGLVIAMLATISITFCSYSYSMRYEQMMELKGAAFIDGRANEIMTQYGIPSAIVDHGVTTDMPKKKVKWGRRELSLTEGNWNLIYERAKPEKKDARFWTNPNPIMPGELSGFSQIVFQTQGGQAYSEFDKKTKRLVWKQPKDVFQAHKVYTISGAFQTNLPISEISERYGQNNEKTRDEAMNKVLRYWVVQYLGTTPMDLYCVDFWMVSDYLTGGYTILNTAIESVSKKYQEIWEKWVKTQPPPEEEKRVITLDPPPEKGADK